jgi:hypothetical protein
VLDPGETCLSCIDGGACVACGGPCATCESCANCKRDKHETDVDCGSTECAARCANNKACKVPSDCAKGACLLLVPRDRRVDGPRVCKHRTCNDEQQNGGDSEVRWGRDTPAPCSCVHTCTRAVVTPEHTAAPAHTRVHRSARAVELSRAHPHLAQHTDALSRCGSRFKFVISHRAVLRDAA